MHPARFQMELALKSIALPKLRDLGFRGSMPHFRRPSEQKADLLSFQFSLSGGAFVVELAVCSIADLATRVRADLTFKDVTAQDMSFRRRLGSSTHGRDHWFVYGKKNYEKHHEIVEQPEHYARIAHQVCQLLDVQAQQWWRERTTDSKPNQWSHQE